MIAVPYVHDKLRPETVAAVQEQWRDPIFFELDPQDPYAYADLLRRLWHFPGDLVVVEHDMVPPPASLSQLHLCRQDWCVHPYYYNGKVIDNGLGVARFGTFMRQRYPALADLALAPHDGRAWTRQGLTNIPPDSNEATIERDGRHACMRPDVQLQRGLGAVIRWPSTITWKTCDTALARLLHHNGMTPHIHFPPAEHLHEA